MKNKLVLLFVLFVFANQVFASVTKIYDKNGFKIGICKKNGEYFEAYNNNEEPILKDALNNDIPSHEAYFYDRNGNLIKFSAEKRTIAPVYIEYNSPEHVILKAPVYGNYRRKLQRSF